MSVFFVDPEIYHRYRDEVLRLSDSQQIDIHEQLPPERRKRGLSDREIAAELGLDERTVTEIRVVAERDRYGLDEWRRAIEFKDEACRAFQDRGLSYVFAGRRKPD